MHEIVSNPEEPPPLSGASLKLLRKKPPQRITDSPVPKNTPDTHEESPEDTVLQLPPPRRLTHNPGFSSGSATQTFRRKHFAEASRTQWNDWKWQLRSRLRTLAQLEKVFHLSEDEREGLTRTGNFLPTAITPYYASLMDPFDQEDPLRRTLIPVSGEFVRTHGEADDPLAEDSTSPIHGLVHRYPDRVLFLALDHCPVYCRYCTRSRVVGSGEMTPDASRWEQALKYLESHSEVRDCLISGGDPLTMSDDRLDFLLGRLRRIPHLEFIRIGTKVPATLPQRITRDLMRVLQRHKPWLSIHFTHPNELTHEVEIACDRLADAGVPMGSQTVLLKRVNDDLATMRALFHGLLKNRVRPYYLYQCDPITGSSHFRTPVEKGLEIIEGLRGHTSGYAVPQFVIDAPGGGGKIPLLPNYVVGRDGDDVVLRNYEGRTFRYPDPLHPHPLQVLARPREDVSEVKG